MSTHVIVLANAKGGSGKSTTAMHIATRLLTLGQRVACVDLDCQQRTLSRYIENRKRSQTAFAAGLQVPPCFLPGDYHSDASVLAFRQQVALWKSQYAFIVVDSPGFDTPLVRLAHQLADTLITPINDSFIDLDLLAQIHPETHQVDKVGWYAELVWEGRKKRFLEQQRRLDWIVMRNRLSHTDARNKRAVAQALGMLSPRLGFRLAAGLGERVIFRELFLKGLTLSDGAVLQQQQQLTLHHLAAHSELRELFQALRLPVEDTAPDAGAAVAQV
jgi:chromosome partitioning protein